MGTTVSSQLAEFISRYSPEIARAFRSCRRRIRAHVPYGYELVFDNYNALGIGYSTRDKASGVILSIVAYPRWVTLFFFNGIELKDPHGLLQGKGSRIRSIRLQSPDDLDDKRVRYLITQALKPHSGALSNCPKLMTVIRTVAGKRRPRRPPTGQKKKAG